MNLEFFPCSGGMAEGFRRAGVRFDLSIDYSADACDSYEHNLGHRPLHMDINDFARLVRGGWRPAAAIELLVADPPCTPWSRAGKREGLADERDCLRVTAELIALLRPRAYLIGNVPGLQDATQWHVVQEVIGGLRDHGYCVRDYAQLDAADYGVPQHRIRPFWFGHLEGRCVRWPERTHAAPAEAAMPVLPGLPQLLPLVTCRQAFSHLPLTELGRPVRMRLREKGTDGRKNGGDDTRCSSPDAPAKTVVAKPDRKGGQILLPHGHPTAHPDAPAPAVTTHGGRAGRRSTTLIANEAHAPSNLDEPAKTVTGGRASRGVQGGRALLIRNGDGHPNATPDAPAPTIRSGGGGHSDAPSHVIKTAGGRAAGNGSMLRLQDPNRPPAPADEPHRTIGTTADQMVLDWPWDRPATTVCSRDTIPPPGHHPETGSILSLPNAVLLSEKAAAILQGFPDGWLFAGKTKAARWGQIGMAMPPALAEAVARGVIEQVLATARERAA